MSATLFNIPSNTLQPGPELNISRGSDGKYTADMTFHCRKGDLAGATIQALLEKGNTLPSLYPDAGYIWSFLLLQEYNAKDLPGGITEISCKFAGTDAEEFDIGNERSVTYTRNSSLREASIFKTEAFQSISPTVQQGIKAIVDGQAYYNADDAKIKFSHNDLVICDLDSSLTNEWEMYQIIVVQGNETYLLPSSEWTKSAVALGPLPSSYLAKLGKIDTPAGNPGAPSGHKWLLTGCTESLQITGDGANSYSLTWTSGDWSEKLYGP